jgi:hypothetical protein
MQGEAHLGSGQEWMEDGGVEEWRLDRKEYGVH